MNVNFRFAVVSDLHIALSHTIQDSPKRFHLVEVSIPALELILERLATLELDFLLLPGDLTQDGEIDNHLWLSQRLAQLPYPVYVVPGNHDVIYPSGTEEIVGLTDFPQYYQQFGYTDPTNPYYTHEILPGVRLIGLNSNNFDEKGYQVGCLDSQQFNWLQQVLAESNDELILVMIHHNVIEHLPDQASNPLGRRYMLDNAPQLLELFQQYGVRLIFTGHLHVQDIAQWQGIYEVTTGSLVSYPHPYRVIQVSHNHQNQLTLNIESDCVKAVAEWPNLPDTSRQWMGDRSFPFMVKLLTVPPLSLPLNEAEQLAPELRNFWADIAGGDAEFNFPNFPPAVRQYFQRFSTTKKIDNNATLVLSKE
ncbi:MAG: metallophosphoesterase [Microcoleaceae cyanobacterium]